MDGKEENHRSNSNQIAIPLAGATLLIDAGILEELLTRLRDKSVPPAGSSPPDSNDTPEADTTENKTNDRLLLRGGFGRHDPRELKVNWHAPIPLGLGEFLILFVLASHSLTASGRNSPHAVAGARFLSVNRILDEIDRVKVKFNVDATILEDATYADIYKIVSKLRTKISRAGGNRNLIETGPRGSGYRLSTPARKVEVQLVPRACLASAPTNSDSPEPPCGWQ